MNLTTTTIFICTLALHEVDYQKMLEIKLEYWLPGITIGASGARQLGFSFDLILKTSR